MKILALVLIIFFTISSPLRGLALSTSEEKKLGERLAKELARKLEIVRDPVINFYVWRVGKRIVKEASDTRFRYRFYVVKEPEPNAFTIPGGHVYVTSGLLRMVEDEDELAGVLAHEVAHSILRHISKAMDRAKRISLATLAAIIAGAFLSRNAKGAEAIGTSAIAMAQSLMLRYTRENEVEADQLGVKLMMRAGYRPGAMVRFLKKIYKWERMTSPDVPTYLRTHPAISDRIAYLSQSYPPTAPDRSQPMGDLRKVQKRVFVIEKGAFGALEQFGGSMGDDPEFLYGLGIALLGSGREEEALRAFQRALSKSPDDPYLLREIGLILYRRGASRRASPYLERAIKAFPLDEELIDALAQVYRKEGRWDEAAFLYERALKEEVRPALYHSLGELYASRGDQVKAHKNFGLFFLKKGDKKMALYHFRKALRGAQGAERGEIERLIEECEP